jgi:hypothetical protein
LICASRSFESDFDGSQCRIQSRPEALGTVMMATTIRAAMIRYYRGGSRQIRQKQMLEIGYVSHCLFTMVPFGTIFRAEHNCRVNK